MALNSLTGYELTNTFSNYNKEGRKIISKLNGGKGASQGEIKYYETYRVLFDILLRYATAQFEWHGLPETVNLTYLERQLTLYGKIAFYETYDGDYRVSDFNVGDLDFYGFPDPKTIKPYSPYQRKEAAIFNPDSVVILYDNKNFTSTLRYIDFYAKRLTSIWLQQESNIEKLHRPYIFKVTSSISNGISASATVLKQAIEDRDSMIVLSKDDFESMDVLNLNVPDTTLNQLQLFEATWQLALSTLGITSQSTKRERMLEQEISVNRQSDQIMLSDRLLPRVEFCNILKEKFGFDVTVNLSSDVIPTDNDNAMFNTIEKLRDLTTTQGDSYHGSIHPDA